MRLMLVAGLALALGAGVAHADGDAAKGERIAKQCAACHSLNDASNKVGPSLLGVYGRKPASVEGYAYSDALKAFGEKNPAWDDATLDAWLKGPAADVPGNKMAYAGVKKDDARADLIAFLKTKK